MCSYKYALTYYDHCEEKLLKVTGFVIADTYSDAVDKLAHYYGEDDIESINLLTFMNDSTVIEVPEDASSAMDAIYDHNCDV